MTGLTFEFFFSTNTTLNFSRDNVKINFHLFVVAILKTHSEDESVGRATFTSRASKVCDNKSISTVQHCMTCLALVLFELEQHAICVFAASKVSFC